MKARIYLQYDYVGESDTLELSEEEYLRMLDAEYERFKTNRLSGELAMHGGYGSSVKWDSCDGEILNDMMGSMTVDEAITQCVRGGALTVVLKLDMDKIGGEFEESYRRWIAESEKARKNGSDLPRIEFALCFRNLAGEKVWARLVGCVLYGVLNGVSDAVVKSDGMVFGENVEE